MVAYFKTNLGSKDTSTGDGIPTIILPSDPNALLERFDLLMASKAAGNTGARNALVTICDESFRQNVFDKSVYKRIVLQL